MTSSRFGRVTKGRAVLYVVFGLFLVALIACYKNASTLLEEAQKAYEVCRQEHDNISQQLHVVSDYKQRLENSLQNEKSELRLMKTEYTNKLNAERQKCEKSNKEAKLLFTSLQQHYNLLQTQHDDFKDECSKIQREQLDAINALQAQLKEAQKAVQDKENTLSSIQTQRDALHEDNEALKAKLSQEKRKYAGEPIERGEFSATRFSKVVHSPNGEYIVPVIESKEMIKSSSTAASVARPLNAPSAVAELSSKAAIKKSTPMFSIPRQMLPIGVVPAPNLMDGVKADAMEKDNVGEKPEAGSQRSELKQQMDLIGDNDNGANEVFDPEQKAGKIRSGVAKGNEDEVNNVINAPDDEGQNDEDIDDDAADGANPEPRDAAIRN